MAMLFVAFCNFIDGTVAGTDISLVDKTVDYSRTYYGNGCDGEWADIPPYYGGSPTSCSTNIVPADSGQDQKIGTYYSYNAGSAGTGDSSMTTQNSNTPDTFCPLGWQLPYSGTGGDYYDQSKSWGYLFTTYGITSSAQGRTMLLSYPLSEVLAGYIHWSRGSLYGQGSQGVVLSATIKDAWELYYMVIIREAEPAHQGPRQVGYSIRCDNNFSIFLSTARWKERQQI